MRLSRSSKFLKKMVELTFTTQKANACSPWTTLSVFDRKYLFGVNLVQKLKIISLSWNFVPRLIQIYRIPWWCSRFLFSTGETKIVNLSWNLVPRLIWICRIMWKISDVYFFCFRPEKPFLGKSGQKNQNCQFKLKFGSKTNLNMWNSLIMFTFSVFVHKYISWANLVQKFKKKFSKWNSIQRLIRIWSKNYNCQFKLKIGT